MGHSACLLPALTGPGDAGESSLTIVWQNCLQQPPDASIGYCEWPLLPGTVCMQMIQGSCQRERNRCNTKDRVHVPQAQLAHRAVHQEANNLTPSSRDHAMRNEVQGPHPAMATQG